MNKNFRIGSDLGVIIFVKSRYATETTKHSHLKIELSPHFIHSRSVSNIQTYMDFLAARIMEIYEPSGCAVHLCVDIQGWQPSKDFADMLVTRSRRLVDHRGISEVEFDLSQVATIYGDSQSYLFGKANGLQFSLYRKDLQAKVIDKLDFWESVWNRRTCENFKPIFDPGKPVWRFEFRFHHSVVKEFSESIQRPMLSFDDLVLHLTALFRYALRNFRLNAVSSSASANASFYRGVYIDPVWQLLMQDVEILGPQLDFFYKRKRKKPGQGGLRNLFNSVGNLTSLYARHGFTAKQSVKCLMQSGIWEDYLAYYRNKYDDLRNLCDDVIKNRITKDIEVRLMERTLAGIAA